MAVKSLIVLRSLMIFCIVLLAEFMVPALAENTTAEIILNPEPPILVQYGNKSQEVTTYSVLEIQLPADICLANYTNVCIELESNSKSYITSVSFDNALFLLVSRINVSIKVVGFEKKEYVSGEGLIISFRLQDTLNLKHVSIKSVLKLSDRKKYNITSLSIARLKNHIIYISINYDRGRLPFVEFNNGDIIKISLDVDNNPLVLVVLLRGPEEQNHGEYSVTQFYTRIANNTRNNMINNTVTTMPHDGAIVVRATSSYISEKFMNPIFIVATILLVISTVILYRVGSNLNK